jgi:hypothetical protein
MREKVKNITIRRRRNRLLSFSTLIGQTMISKSSTRRFPPIKSNPILSR